MGDRLKPCPFCGGEASIYEEIPDGYIVQCHDCCGQTGIMTKEHAITAWNARAEQTCRIENSYLIDEVLDQPCTELSCGHVAWQFAPKFCPECGAKVVDE